MRPHHLLAASLIIATTSTHAAEPCQTFHGRSTYSRTNGMFRIWHIGTHHTFMPTDARNYSDDYDNSWQKVMDRLQGTSKDPEAASNNALFATFTVCPTEPFREGASQRATVKAISHPYVALHYWDRP